MTEIDQLKTRLGNLEWFVSEVLQHSPAQIAEMRARKSCRESAAPPPDPAELD